MNTKRTTEHRKHYGVAASFCVVDVIRIPCSHTKKKDGDGFMSSQLSYS